MTKFSPNEIAGLIYLVGNWGPGSKDKAPAFLDTAIAVCLAESGGEDTAINPPATKNPDGSYTSPDKYATGLWQIMYPDHRDLLDKYGEKYATSPGTMKLGIHPLVNTSAARDLQQTQGWQPWTAYTNGAYKKYTGHGAAAYAWISNKNNVQGLQAKMANYGANAAPPKIAIDTSWQDVLKGFPQFFGNFLKQAGITTAIFIGGSILVILGAWFLLSQNADKIAKFTPQGAAAKAVLKTVKK